MQELDTRVEVKIVGAQICSFTITIGYIAKPSIGDHIVFSEGIISKITYICHYVGRDASIVIGCDPIIVKEYNEFISTIEWFKVHYNIRDVKADEAPQSYYIFYRSLLRLLKKDKTDSPSMPNTPAAVRVLGEACRSIMIGSLEADPLSITTEIVSKYNHYITELYRNILDIRSMNEINTREICHDISLLELIKGWEKHINFDDRIHWTDDDHLVESIMIKILTKLPSITKEELAKEGLEHLFTRPSENEQ